MDQQLANIFSRYEDVINDGTIADMAVELFRWSIKYDEEAAKVFIFRNSPIFLANPNLGPLLHFLPCSSVLVQLLIDAGVNVDEQDIGGSTALHAYITLYAKVSSNKHKYLNVIKVLLKNGANREISDREGLTPIQLCLFLGKLELVEEFLKEEEKLPNAIEVYRNKRCQHVIKCLVQEKDDWNIPRCKNYSILLHFLAFENNENLFYRAAKNTKFDVNACNHKGYTLLHVVAEHGTALMMRTLIDMGGDFDVDVPCYKTPLIASMRNPRAEVFHCLVNCGASVNRSHDSSPLNYAVYVQRLEMVEKLVKLGADVNGLVCHQSPLLIACGKYSPLQESLGPEYIDIITKTNFYITKFLLDNGADIEAKNALNRTALDQACRFGKLYVVRLLLSHGAKIDQGDVSTLYHAVKGDNLAIIKHILEQGADVNVIADPVRRETPLHLVCHSQYMENDFVTDKGFKSRSRTIKLLLTHNADVNALDGKGLVPLNYALRNYMFPNNEDLIDNSPNGFKRDLVFLVAFITKMIEAKEYVIEFNRILLKDDIVRPIYEECVNELNLMKKENICESRNFSFFNVLCKDIQLLGNALKNKDFFQALNSDEYKKKFPIYAEFLKDRVREATILQSNVALAIVLFQKHISRNFLVDLHFDVLRHLFNFLNLRDFQNFAEACFVNVY